MNLAQGRPISAKHLPKAFVEQNPIAEGGRPASFSRFAPLEDIEKEYILKVYGAMQKNKLKTARVLGIVANTLRRKLEIYGVD